MTASHPAARPRASRRRYVRAHDSVGPLGGIRIRLDGHAIGSDAFARTDILIVQRGQ